MKLAYLTNQYPHVRHTFIRREIVALEALGMPVERYSMRASGHDVVDPADIEERGKTFALLSVGALGLLRALILTGLTRPLKMARALGTVWAWGRRSDAGVLRHLIYLAEACVLRSRLATQQVTHLHVHFATNPATVARLCEQLGGPPFSLTIHGPEEWDRPESLSLRQKYEAARFVVAVSDYGRCQVYRWVGYSYWDHVHVVHCGVDAAFLSKKPTPVLDVRRFVLVGALVEQKGHLILIRALHQLHQQGVSLEVVFAGDGPLRGLLERECERLGIHDMVQFRGWVSNAQVREELQQCRAMVMSSLAENLPVAMMEAMAMGRPVIGTYVAGIPELVRPGETGWLVPAGNPEAVARAIQACLDTPIETLQAMGERAAQLVAQEHDALREAARLLGLFRAVEGSTATPRST